MTQPAPASLAQVGTPATPQSSIRGTTTRVDLAHDLILPTILFMALGGMTWAIRGCSGFGAMNGCVFAGVTWGTAWWFIARVPAAEQRRRYSSGWIILALTVGIGISGNRGWMQWPSFFEGHLQLNTPQGKFAPISRGYGFLWLFIAGVPWAGLGACLLAWCAPKRPLRPINWALRLGSGVVGALTAAALFHYLPEVFLPLFKTLGAEYADLQNNPNLRRLINDNRAALIHLGFYLGFLAYELARRDWKNVILICTVGLINGTGWALCQNWRWAAQLWPGVNFNWWRCWESCGGLSIGLAYGLAYFLVNRPCTIDTTLLHEAALDPGPAKLEKFAAYAGLILGLGLSIKNGLKGWANIYLGNEGHWNQVFWSVIGPLMLLCLGVLASRLRSAVSRGARGDLFPNDYKLIWLVFIIQNVIAQLVTGPRTVWNEMAFKIYYVLLLLISAVVVHHLHEQRNAAYGCGRVE